MEKKQPAIAITSEPIRGTYRISPEQAVVYEAIIATAIRKALPQDWFNDFVSFDDSGGSLLRRGSEPRIYYRDKEGLRVQFLNGSFHDILFHPGFAHVLGYTLADLGAWCDAGNEAVHYVAQLLDGQ